MGCHDHRTTTLPLEALQDTVTTEVHEFSFVKNLSTGSHFSCEKFFHLPRFLQVLLNFKDSIEKIWRPKMFYQVTNSWFLAGYPSSDHIILQTWPIEVPLIDVSSYLHDSDANKVTKMKNW